MRPVPNYDLERLRLARKSLAHGLRYSRAQLKAALIRKDTIWAYGWREAVIALTVAYEDVEIGIAEAKLWPNTRASR